MLYMSLKYGAGGTKGGAPLNATERFRSGVLANANRGGENVATGALVGALLGAQCGYSGLPKDLLRGLAPSQRDQLDSEIDAFTAAVPLARM